jgi:hypothetical protein
MFGQICNCAHRHFGAGVRLEVKTPKDIGPVKKLAAIKLAN